MAGKMRRSEASSSSSGGGGGGSRRETVVVDCGRRKSSCGYCKSAGRTSISHGLWADSITVDDYQDLLDRGWRRSGCFLYKPEMERTCCPAYTIRLRASDFVPSKEQQRVLRKMQRFLEGTLDAKKMDEEIVDRNISKGACSCTCHEVPTSATKETLTGKDEDKGIGEHIMNYLSDQVDKAGCTCKGSGELPCELELPKASVKRVSQGKRKLLVEGAEDLMYTSNIAFQIAAAIRRAQSAIKDTKHSAEDNCLSPNYIAEKLVASLDRSTYINGLEIRACNGHINFYTASAEASTEGTEVLTRSEKSATGCKRKGCCVRKISEHPPVKRQRRLELRLKRSTFDPEEFALYRRYQMIVHDDSPNHVTENSYRMFLVDTPLAFVPPSGDGRVPPCGFGSFHQQYLIDGQLVAVGVIDILPKCLSSKYLFWDPDFAFLSLGKYSALQEINWVKENQAHCPSLQFYYLGYYIHSCCKMRYKAAYGPSKLLCPLRYEWVEFDIARPLLDRKPYVVLSDYALRQKGEALPLTSDASRDLRHDDYNNEDSNDIPVGNDDGEMMGPDFESSDNELGLETSGPRSVETENYDVGDILIGLRGSHVRYKDLRRAFGPNKRGYLERQLHRYQKVVGAELAKRMAYSLRMI